MSADACSDASAGIGEQLAGTAPQAAAWVALEQPGPWGARAFTASHLDRDLGRRIESIAEEHGVRPSLVRRPGRHADDHHDAPRRVLVAWTHPQQTWLLEGHIPGPDALLDLDWGALARGDRDAVRRSLPSLRPSDRAHLLVCTNGRRDVCCAVKGRPVALEAAAARPEQVWEVTHTSGHRFAPTSVLLPSGTLHGRLDGGAARRILAAAARGETVLPGSRGRSTWPAAAQAAELAVREEVDELALDALSVVDHREVRQHCWATRVAHTDGRSWDVEVSAHEAAGDVRPESCGKPLKPVTYLTTLLDSPVQRRVR
jgi:hypothetical protein